VRNKARLVDQDFSQVEGLDFQKAQLPHKLFHGSICFIAMRNCFVVIDHIATCKSFVAIISIVAKQKYFMVIWHCRQIEYLVMKP
jgi:hypothetical protein